jgi:hypothetical protein
MKQRDFLISMFLLASDLLGFSPAEGQTTQTILAKAAAAFSQGKSVNGVTLNATAEWIAGSDDETGNATLTANADGSYSIQLQLAQSARTEAQTSFSSGQSCTWSGTDGISHPVASHNCMGSVTWFLPGVTLFGKQQPSAVNTILTSTSAVSAGPQLLDIRQQNVPTATSSDTVALLTHLSTSDVYLNPTTYLPMGLVFNIHPDDNAASDIPVQIVFTDYQSINGVSIPFRIQRYVNGSLQLDLTVTQASTN